MKILITNTVMLNGGDAAILAALMRHVRAVFGPDADIVVADTQPEIAARHYPKIDVIAPLYVHMFPPRRASRFAKVRGLMRFARWYSSLPRLYVAAVLLSYGNPGAARLLTTRGEWESLRHYAEADAIISTGGTYLVENYWLGPRIFDFRMALLLRKPLVLYTQSMGPFVTPRVRRALASIFRSADLILLRDEASLKHVHDIVPPSEMNARLGADAAFALADGDVLGQAAALQLPDRDFKVAISVRDWPFFETMSAEEGMDAYVTAVAETVEVLVRRYHATVTFLSTCQGVPGYTYDDSLTAQTIADRLPQDVRAHVDIDADFHRPEALVERLSEFHLVVATRMHMAILALVAGCPVLPIAYEFKTKALFDRLGMGAYVTDIEAVSNGRLRAALVRFIDDLPSIRRKLFERVEEERRRADVVAEYLDIVRRTALKDADGFGGRIDADPTVSEPIRPA